jgi:hypothetical protein
VPHCTHGLCQETTSFFFATSLVRSTFQNHPPQSAAMPSSLFRSSLRCAPSIASISKLGTRRAYSSVVETVPLAYTRHDPPADSPKPSSPLGPLVILHGLFGSKQNNRSISK